ncbi:MAG: thioredoxin fold domain-containing protein [Arenicellales bacterium]
MKTTLLSFLIGIALPAVLLASYANLQGEDADSDIDAEFEDDTSLYDDKLPWATDLSRESHHAACKGQPLVVMFGSSECPYCSVVRSLYMVPLSKDTRYPGIVVRELEIDSETQVKDFSGKVTSMRKLAASYGVYLVPTVMVFGPDGKQTGKPVIGISNEDFYGFYLDEKIANGVSMVKKILSANALPSASLAAYACD